MYEPLKQGNNCNMHIIMLVRELFYSKRLFTVAVDRSVPDKLDWWHKADKPSAVQDSGQRQCHTRQNAKCPLLTYALDLEETYGHRENWKRERDKNRDFNCAHLSRSPTLSKTAQIVELFLFIYLSLTSFTSGSLEKSHCLSCIPRLSHSSGDIIKWSTAIDKLRMYEASDVTNSNLAWKVKKKKLFLFQQNLLVDKKTKQTFWMWSHLLQFALFIAEVVKLSTGPNVRNILPKGKGGASWWAEWAGWREVARGHRVPSFFISSWLCPLLPLNLSVDSNITVFLIQNYWERGREK